MVLTRASETATLQHIITYIHVQDIGRPIEKALKWEGFSTLIQGYDEFESGEVTLSPLHRGHKGLLCTMQAYINNLSDMKPISSESEWTKTSMAEIDEFRISKVFFMGIKLFVCSHHC